MGASQRLKGHNWEREVARRLRKVMPGCGAKRGLQTRFGSSEEADVEIPCFHVECKVGKKTRIMAALNQAVEAEKKGRWPIAVCKDDRKPPVVLMRLDDFEEILGQWWMEHGRFKATADALEQVDDVTTEA